MATNIIQFRTCTSSNTLDKIISIDKTRLSLNFPFKSTSPSQYPFRKTGCKTHKQLYVITSPVIITNRMNILNYSFYKVLFILVVLTFGRYRGS